MRRFIAHFISVVISNVGRYARRFRNRTAAAAAAGSFCKWTAIRGSYIAVATRWKEQRKVFRFKNFFAFLEICLLEKHNNSLIVQSKT